MSRPAAESRHGYLVGNDHFLEGRRVLLRGGLLDGRVWTGRVDVGARVFCGDGAWTTREVYLVTAQTETVHDGEANVAIPAFA